MSNSSNNPAAALGWEMYRCSTSRKAYYANKKTGESQWDPPAGWMENESSQPMNQKAPFLRSQHVAAFGKSNTAAAEHKGFGFGCGTASGVKEVHAPRPTLNASAQSTVPEARTNGSKPTRTVSLQDTTIGKTRRRLPRLALEKAHAASRVNEVHAPRAALGASAQSSASEARKNGSKSTRTDTSQDNTFGTTTTAAAFGFGDGTASRVNEVHAPRPALEASAQSSAPEARMNGSKSTRTDTSQAPKVTLDEIRRNVDARQEFVDLHTALKNQERVFASAAREAPSNVKNT